MHPVPDNSTKELNNIILPFNTGYNISSLTNPRTSCLLIVSSPLNRTLLDPSCKQICRSKIMK